MGGYRQGGFDGTISWRFEDADNKNGYAIFNIRQNEVAVCGDEFWKN
jgi:hypothetical protein